MSNNIVHYYHIMQTEKLKHMNNFEMIQFIIKDRYPDKPIETNKRICEAGFTMKRENYDKIKNLGPLGRTSVWCYYPNSEHFLHISIKSNLEKIEKLRKIPRGQVSEDTDGIWNYVNKKIIKGKQYIKHRRVIKKPCFHALYLAMLKINPDYTEEEMIGEETIACNCCASRTFNKNVVEDIEYTYTTIEEIYDPVNAEYNICVMYDDIDRHFDYILKEIESLV